MGQYCQPGKLEKKDTARVTCLKTMHVVYTIQLSVWHRTVMEGLSLLSEIKI